MISPSSRLAFHLKIVEDAIAYFVKRWHVVLLYQMPLAVPLACKTLLPDPNDTRYAIILATGLGIIALDAVTSHLSLALVLRDLISFRKGEKIAPSSNAGAVAKRAMVLIGSGLILTPLIFFGMQLYLIPALFFVTAYLFVPCCLIVDEKCSIWAAFTRSWRYTRTAFFGLLTMVIVFNILGLLIETYTKKAGYPSLSLALNLLANIGAGGFVGSIAACYFDRLSNHSVRQGN